MVMEMKQGFSTAMEELSKIQYGDQNLQQQLADNKKDCAAEVKVVTDTVEELKVQTLRNIIYHVYDVFKINMFKPNHINVIICQSSWRFLAIILL